MSKSEQLFENYYNTLESQLELAVLFYANYKYITSFDYLNNPNYENYVDFFESVRLSSSISLASQINKILIKGGNGIVIKDLLDHAIKYPQIFGKSKQETNLIVLKINSEFEQYKGIIEKLREHRNKFHSHLGDKYSEKGNVYAVFKEFQVDFEELEVIFDFLCRSIYSLNFIMKEGFSNFRIIRYLNNKNSIHSLTNIDLVVNKLRN